MSKKLGPNSRKAFGPDGMSVVIKQVQRDNVKYIRQAIARRSSVDIDENVLQRFLTENRRVQEGDFVVLNYIEGVNVCDALAEYPCESDEIVSAVVRIVRATLVPMLGLEINGLSHGDIHGRNVILSGDNSAGLIDIDYLSRANSLRDKKFDVCTLGQMACALLGIDIISSIRFVHWKMEIEERIRQCSEGVRSELEKLSKFILLAIDPNHKKRPTIVEAMQMMDDKANLSEV